MSDDVVSNVPGPFSSPLNALLSESFGQSLDAIQVDRQHDSAAAMNAKAYTIGNKISLGAGIDDDVSDVHSMEVISHEVAHALAGGGSGEKLLDEGRDDDGESAAHVASGSFRDYIASGARGAAPRLTPAFGGKAAVHRYEAGEHADAVDNAEATLKAANEAGGGHKVNQGGADQIKRTITLENGVTVHAGDITAMMGDFYGAYTMGADGKEHFDPAASFEAMNNAKPEEMEALLAKIKKERESVEGAKNGGTFEHTENAEFESLTNDRHLKTDENGTTTGYSYMDLAQKNSNHFNQKDEVDADGNPITDNNMGAYTAFHGMAMKAAQDAAALPPGEAKEKAEQKALALEASSQHFLTDRFAGGHQFDKEQMVAENGGGKIANLRARTIHDELNENGAMVENSKGERWRALGDSHWADEANAENRAHTAETVLNSYGDIDSILKGEKTAADFEKDKAATAHETAPVWDEAENKRLQEAGKDKSVLGMLANNVDEIGLLPTMVETWAKQEYHEREDWVKEKGSDAWSWTKDTAGDVRDWTKEKANEIGDGASDAWDYTKDKAGDVEDWAEDKWDSAKETADDVVDYGSEKIDDLKEGAGEAWETAQEYGSDAVDYGSEKIDDVKEGAGEAWESAQEYGGDAVDYASEKVDQVEEAASETWEGAKDLAGDAGDTISDGYDSVKDGALGLIGL
jgi:hypothetical protein